MDAPTLLAVLDLGGTAVFAVSGALVAVRKELDLFGVLTVAVATALGGGLVRDALIGVRPPAAFQDWRYLVVPAVTGLVTFFLHRQVERLTGAIRLFDAAGLALFVVSGTTVALRAGLGPVPAVAMGVLTGVGGGVVRDVLVREIPVVLQRELYAVPALLGATVVVVADRAGVQGAGVAGSAAVLVFGVRVAGIALDVHFPRATSPGRHPGTMS